MPNSQVPNSQAGVIREAIAASPGIVLVDFSAEWCPPCRMLEPIIDQLENESADLTVVRIDVDATPELARPYFVRLRELRDRLATRSGLALRELSMGMTEDFEVAIEEGATMVRVGRAVFGERPK